MRQFLVPQSFEMQNIICCVIASSIWLAVLSVGQHINCDYEAYLVEQGKSYGASQRSKREKIFEEKCAELQKIEEQANGTYHVGLNKFTDWSEKQIAAYLHPPISIEERRQAYKVSASVLGVTPTRVGANGTFATQIDYRNIGGKSYVTYAKDQGACGSCWSFTVAEMFESYHMLYADSGSINFSEQYILDCSGAGTCADGGVTSLAIQFGRGSGMVLESDSPYKGGAQGLSVDQCKAYPKVYFNTSKYPYYRKPYRLNDNQIKQILTDHGPISVALYSSGNSFLGYRSGIYSGCPSDADQKIDHGALLVGYDSDGNWIIKNSWGTSWGMNGFALISKDYNCGIDLYADYFIFNNGTTTLKARLSSTGKTGYNGYILGIKQNGKIVSQFGANFTYGSLQFIEGVLINLNQTATIVVVQQGSGSEQLGLILYDELNNIWFRFNSGNAFTDNNNVGEFCPDCLEVKFDPALSDGNTNPLFVTLTYVLGAIAGLLLIITISLCVAVRKQKNAIKTSKATVEAYKKQMEQMVPINNGQGYGLGAQEGVGPQVQKVQNQGYKLATVNKRKAPLPPPPNPNQAKKPSQPKNQNQLNYPYLDRHSASNLIPDN